jgi:hypothetical protein
MRVMLLLAATAELLATQPVHAEDNCEDVGRLSFMLAMVSQNDCNHRLTAYGRRVSLNMTRKMNELGGMSCWDKGKVAVEKELAWKLKRSDNSKMPISTCVCSARSRLGTCP